jgi:hypothetical protein
MSTRLATFQRIRLLANLRGCFTRMAVRRCRVLGLRRRVIGRCVDGENGPMRKAHDGFSDRAKSQMAPAG